MKENLHIFYAPDAAENATVYLSDEEAAHCCKVLRLATGDHIAIADGRGTVYNAVITVCSKSTCAAQTTDIISDIYRRNYFNHVAIAPTKNIDRFEWFVEKAVEFGVDTITPLLCDHSERKILKTDRLEKIALSAFKQSGNAVVTTINPLTPFADVIKTVSNETKLIAHCEDGEKTFFSNAVLPRSSSITLIGPEGDFSDKEITLALSSGFCPVSLGNTRLRTETAGVAVCAFLAALNN